ncbi:MAG: DNA (cytosine-5-)-methyltransferase [Olsenella sp.]|nr:DNA (cytosine-5-)-methyltransferase [Olsenella sp.]
MDEEITVAELFAGVGGFRLGLEGYSDDAKGWNLPSAGPYRTIWVNQWEPGSDKRQFAARCYESHFGKGSVVNEDIAAVLDEYDAGERSIPDVDMVVGGFPCQDYSVARPLSQADGIEGKKGVLWWSIYRFLRIQLAKSGDNAQWCMFENVDRLLKSPAKQRGRDFAIILSCLASLGYSVEWRVVNSAEYGFPQRRKRVYILAERNTQWDLKERLLNGVMASAFPIEAPESVSYIDIPADPYVVSQSFNVGGRLSPFADAGVMVENRAITCKALEAYNGPRETLGDVLVPEAEVPEEFFVPESQRGKWEYLKGSKKEKRTNKATGFEYNYSEGAMSFPDPTDRPSRTILTGEGGRGASRFKHVVQCEDGRLRRLVPDELDQLQCFPKGWTDTGMTDGQRAFCMGNALVVGIPHRIGVEVAKELSAGEHRADNR